jgi:hypothetical protein
MRKGVCIFILKRRIIQCTGPAWMKRCAGVDIARTVSSVFMWWLWSKALGCVVLLVEQSVLDLRRLWLVDCDDDSDNDRNDDENNDRDEQAPPLLAVAAARRGDCGANLLVAFCDVLADLLALLLNVGDHGLLLLHDLVEVLEELGELDHLTLDVLDRFVALLDVAQGGAGLPTAVRAEELRNMSAKVIGLRNLDVGSTYSLLEDGRFRIRNSLPDFCFCSIGAHDTVLALGSSL